ncbi:hypothetical protein TNCV_2660871 [Trichonephila clavipes]|nr:hypothetical protein TNCV_2660871 [Trichonephila clavipes]
MRNKYVKAQCVPVDVVWDASLSVILGHVEEVKDDILPNPYYYIPHQVVLGPDKSTTKLRVVFNASAKTSNGISLNTLLKDGAVQNELWCLVYTS